MAKKLLGHVECPECGFVDAEVAEDKSGHLYRYCPDCNAQYFSRGDATRTANLKKKMRPIKPAGDPSPVDPPNPLGAPKIKRGVLDDFLAGK